MGRCVEGIVVGGNGIEERERKGRINWRARDNVEQNDGFSTAIMDALANMALESLSGCILGDFTVMG